jgi:hypothetical protein
MRERVPVVIAVALAAAAFVGVGCSNRGVVECGDRPIPPEAVPTPAGFRVIQNVQEPPEGCGARYRRLVVYERRHGDAVTILTTFTDSIVTDGWHPTECVTAVERLPERLVLP